MSGHVVVPVEVCQFTPEKCAELHLTHRECHGCLGDGTRAVLDQAVAVEKYDGSAWVPWRDLLVAWREVES